MTSKLVRRTFRVVLGAAAAWYVVAFLFFDEDNLQRVAGQYHTANYGDGVALHWYADASRPFTEPLVESVYALYRSPRFLIARASTDVYFLYPINAASASEAASGQRGPFTKGELVKELVALREDTVLQSVGSL